MPAKAIGCAVSLSHTNRTAAPRSGTFCQQIVKYSFSVAGTHVASCLNSSVCCTFLGFCMFDKVN